MQWLTSHLKAHALIFEPCVRARYQAAAGLRLLAIFLLLEGIVGPRRASPPLRLVAALLLIRYAARVRLAEIGLSRWRDWTRSEKAYLLQIGPLAIAIFAMITGSRLQALAAEPSIWTTAALMSVSYFVWGFYQEVMYRGILQTEMVRRFGTAAGMVVANVAYTFGPLHLYYFKTYQPPVLYGLFAAVFLVGLFFGALFHRSGNLVIVGVLHGVGDIFLTGLPQLT